MTSGPIFTVTFQYQARTGPVTTTFPETVTADRWFQPFSLPPPPKPGLHASRQQFQPYAETARFPEIVSEDRWHQPWSEPPKPKVSVGTASQQFLALTEAAPFTETVTEDRWHQPWSEPVRQKIGIAATEHPLVSLDPFPFVSFSWFKALSEPVRTALRLIAGANQDNAFSESARFPEIVSEDRWHQPWSEPVRRATNVALQSTTTFTPVVTATPTASVDGWGTALSIPQRQRLGLPAGEQQSLAFSGAAPFPEAISEDRWHQPWSEPVKTRTLAPAQQQSLAFVPVTTTQVFEDSWHQGWADPIQLKAAWKTGDTSANFVATSAPVPLVSGWATAWVDPIQLRAPWKAGDNSFGFAAPQASAIPTVDGWGSPLSDPIQLRALWKTGDNSYGFGAIQANVPTVDGWGAPFIEVPKPKAGTTAACQQFFAFDPQPFAAPVPSFGYFAPFSEPQRQLAGLAARLQQTIGFGDVPRVPPFVFFFGSEEPYPYPTFRQVTFIRENYDQLAFPPFPIPNPPVTQAKFTVSGPSVSDLFPVPGVVYPYAPETRKTVP